MSTRRFKSRQSSIFCVLDGLLPDLWHVVDDYLYVSPEDARRFVTENSGLVLTTKQHEVIQTLLSNQVANYGRLMGSSTAVYTCLVILHVMDQFDKIVLCVGKDQSVFRRLKEIVEHNTLGVSCRKTTKLKTRWVVESSMASPLYINISTQIVSNATNYIVDCVERGDKNRIEGHLSFLSNTQ